MSGAEERSPSAPNNPSPFGSLNFVRCSEAKLRRSERVKNQNKAKDGSAEAHVAQDMTHFAFSAGQEISKSAHPGTLNKIDKMKDKKVRSKYINGVVNELKAHTNLSTFKISKKTDLLKGSNIIDTGFIHKLKSAENSKENFVKSRLVGRDYGQKFGIDFFESYAPAMNPVVSGYGGTKRAEENSPRTG